MPDVKDGSAAGGQPGADGAGSGGVAPPGAAPWFAALPEQVRGTIESKGWQGPEAVVESYMNLEKLLGADKAGRGVVWPKDEQDAEGWKAINAKLGVPETPDGYKIPVPEKGGDPEFAKLAASWFHKAGVPAKAAAIVAESWNGHVAGLVAAADKAAADKAAIEEGELKTEWGATFEQNTEIAKRGAREFGVTDEQFDALEQVLGLKATVKFFNAIGSKIGEAPVDGLAGGERGRPTISTPEGAKARLAELRSGPEWVAKYVSGDADAKREIDRLTDVIARGQMAADAAVARRA